MTTVIVDYESGNLHSAEKAFQKMAAETGAGQVLVTADPEVVARAERVVLPGDGAFPACRAALFEKSGLFESIEQAVLTRARPFLGICIGMQMMGTRGMEYRETPGFGWIDGTVERIAPADPALKVPHMGWNELVIDRPHPVLADLPEKAHAYFVHSYQMTLSDPDALVAHADYAGPVTAIVARDTMLGTQFHPEKSHRTGLGIIRNFLAWTP